MRLPLVARQFHAANVEQARPALAVQIISRHRAYHGNTAGAMAATGQADGRSASGRSRRATSRWGLLSYRSRETEEQHGLIWLRH